MPAITQTQNFDWKQVLAKDGHLDRVLVSVDFSSSTNEMLRYARALAEEFGAVIELLHVIPATVKRAKGATRGSLIRTMGEAGRQELSKLLEVLWPSEIKATVVIREGPAREAILEEARASKAQLIILGERGTRGWSRWLQRRALSQLVRRSPCLVLLIPHESDAAAKKIRQILRLIFWAGVFWLALMAFAFLHAPH
jgi:nucleotide-binding universal stress UspA family protein